MDISKWRDMVESYASLIQSLIEMYGEDYIFAPDVPHIVPDAKSTELAPIQHNTPNSKTSSTASSARSRTVLSHEFRWLEMPRGVWTVLKARLER